jgi:hypothetical protein
VLSNPTGGREAPGGRARPALFTGEPDGRAHWLRVTSTAAAWCGLLVAVGYTTVAALAQYVAMSVADAVARRRARVDAGLVARAPPLERVIGVPRAAQERVASGRAPQRGGPRDDAGASRWPPRGHVRHPAARGGRPDAHPVPGPR